MPKSRWLSIAFSMLGFALVARAGIILVLEGLPIFGWFAIVIAICGFALGINEAVRKRPPTP
ncbi:MAG: hypothetical protein ACR2HJ_13205 [Fimbriimonadales bacterium]